MRIADEMGLHLFIRTGSDVKKLTGKAMLNVRADVVESLIATIYLDGGLEAARSFILKYWQGRANGADAGRRDAKTELQEWAHAKFAATPNYRVDDRSGPDHDPRFTVTVEIPGVAPETGVDRSKTCGRTGRRDKTIGTRRRLAETICRKLIGHP